MDKETQDAIERTRQDLRQGVDEHIGEHIEHMKHLAETELTAADERRNRPICSTAQAMGDAEVVARPIKGAFSHSSRSADHIRLVARMFKGFVDTWYPPTSTT